MQTAASGFHKQCICASYGFMEPASAVDLELLVIQGLEGNQKMTFTILSKPPRLEKWVSLVSVLFQYILYLLLQGYVRCRGHGMKTFQ
jgi:hypothetical protein